MVTYGGYTEVNDFGYIRSQVNPQSRICNARMEAIARYRPPYYPTAGVDLSLEEFSVMSSPQIDSFIQSLRKHSEEPNVMGARRQWLEIGKFIDQNSPLSGVERYINFLKEFKQAES